MLVFTIGDAYGIKLCLNDMSRSGLFDFHNLFGFMDINISIIR